MHDQDPHISADLPSLPLLDVTVPPFNAVSDTTIGAGSLAELAFRNAGPAAVGFLDWIIEQSRQDGIDHILFVGDAGHILQTLMQGRRLNSPGAALPPSSHLPASHVLFMLSNMDSTNVLGIDESRFFIHLPAFLDRSNGLSTAELLERSGIPIPSDAVMKDLGLDREQRLPLSDATRLTDFLLAWRWEILKVCRRNRRGLFRYMHRLGLGGGQRLALVGIDWHGATQNAFEQALRDFMPLNVMGYHFALADSQESRERRNTLRMKAFLDADTIGSGLMQAIAANHVAIEFLFCTEQKPVIGFSEDSKDYIIDPGRADTRLLSAQRAEIGLGIRQFASQTRHQCGQSSVAMAMPLLHFVADGRWANHPHLAQVKNFDAWITSSNCDRRLADYAVKPQPY
ncbi:hypothetical protein [Gluconacetobacter liquefaciens]|uniref:Uncharacterized protein n=2 Tax=Gluconacetobacter liquefaciens TaxID=89584 RepID=A0A370G7K4_GLULI|nr:hypothetical protein [Gluconacetobacter liquefaciens]RDI39777.1 hypothetical protein C7453_102573 [Gluconacetobacter liquefaciens]